jgi:exonuclease SbcC
MIPVELRLHNFLAYRDPEPLLLEGIHIACLAGPNGAGKSSMLDAITWCVWGKARSNSADELIHQGQEEMQVSLVFDQAGTRYRVMRQRTAGKRGASLLEFQAWDGESDMWQPISEGAIRETQAKIDHVLSLDYETFVNSAFLVQGRADEFTTKTPGQRKQVLASILGLSQWEVYEGRAKDHIQASKAAIQRLEGRLEEVEKELGQRDAHHAELEAAELSAKDVSARLAAAEKQWSDLEQTRRELVSLQRQLDDLTNRTKARQKELDEANQELASSLSRANKAAIGGAMEELREQLEKLESAQAAWDEASGRRAELAETAAKLQGANQAMGPETEPLKARTQTLEQATDPICPTCGQPLTEDHRHRLVAELKEEIEGRRETYRKNSEKIRELEQEEKALDARLQSLNSDITKRRELERKLAQLEADLKHADEAQDHADTLTARIGRWEGELQNDKDTQRELEAQAESTQKRLKDADLSEKDVESLRLEKRLADERVGGARQKLAALDAFEKQRAELRSQWDEQTSELGVYEELREAFSKRGVPAMIIETVVPELERHANELLSRMTDGRLHVRIETQREIKTGELREALDIIISDELGSRPYELYSGGEAFRINFAIRIALSKLLANRAGAQLRSLFMDEGFGTQDASGREHLVEAINSIQDDFDLILVITHIEELKEAFPARIEVRKTPEGSQFSLT